MNTQVRNFIFIFSGIMVVVGAILFITRWFYASYLFSAGSAGITLCFMTLPYQNLDFRQRRLHRINVLAGISLLGSSFFMMRQQMEWVVFTLISALLILYTSFFAKNRN